MMPAEPADRAALAAEYVIGSLPEAERAGFERELARDFDLQREVYFWQDRLLPMTRMMPPVEPSAGLWARIERGIADRGARSPAPTEGVRWWQGVAFWRLGTAASLLLAVALGLRLLAPTAAPPPDTRFYAVLQSPDRQEAGWIVEAAAGGKLRLIPLVTTAVAPDKALQFWTKPKDASGPTSLGLVPPDRVTEIDVARLPALEPDQLFELTLEPPGGSPIGRPTGPILFVGRTVNLAVR